MYPLSETQYCPCNKYNAQPVGNWSDCVLPEGGRVEGQLNMKVQGDIKECGQGYRYQAMVCYDQDNRIVETSRCNSHGQSLSLKLTTVSNYPNIELFTLRVSHMVNLFSSSVWFSFLINDN